MFVRVTEAALMVFICNNCAILIRCKKVPPADASNFNKQNKRFYNCRST